jgi:hypothetical protein
MCGLTEAIIASTIASVAGSVVQYQEQKDMHEENAEQAIQAKMYEDQQIAINQANQQQDAAAQKIRNNQEAQKAAARARVAQGESGGFLENNAVVQDIMAQGLTGNNQISTNLDRLDVDTKFQQIAATNKAQSRINAVSAPSAAATTLQIGSDVAGGATDYYSIPS